MIDNISDKSKSNKRLNLKKINNDSDYYDGVGTELKSARIRSGKEISEVARDIRINRSYIESIEKGKFNDLPGEAYIIGFLNSYSKYLDLDQKIVIEQFKKETVRKENQSLEFPITRDSNALPTRKIIFSSIFLLLISYLVYVYFQRENSNLEYDISSVPERIINEAENTFIKSTEKSEQVSGNIKREGRQLNSEEKSESIIKEDQNFDQSSKDEINILNSQEESDSPAAESDSSAAESDSPAAESDSSALTYSSSVEINNEELDNASISSEKNINIINQDEKTEDFDDPLLIKNKNDEVSANQINLDNEAIIYSDENRLSKLETSNSRLSIFAADDSWVQVYNEEGEIFFSGLVRKGKHLRIPDRKDLLLSAGNAGSLKISIDGKLVPFSWLKGEIVQNYSLDLEGFQ